MRFFAACWKSASLATMATALVALCLVVPATTVHAGVSPAVKCQTAKLKAAGKKGGCRGKAAAKAVKKGLSPDYSKCSDKFDKGFQKAEDKGGVECPSTGDATTVEAVIDACTDDVFVDLGDVPGPGGGVEKCESRKLKAVGKYLDCVFKAQGKAIKKGESADISKCTDKLGKSFDKADSKPPCATTGGALSTQSALNSCFGSVYESVSGVSWPADSVDYTPGPVAYMNSLTIPTVSGGVPDCCKDFGPISKDFINGGTNNVDNALAVLADSASGLFDLQATLTDSLVNGELVLLFDHQYLDAGNLPDDFAFVGLRGQFDAGTTFPDADAGMGEFLITPDSFFGGTGTPVNVFFPATMTASSMSTAPSTLGLPIPFGVVTLDLPVRGAEISADHGAITMSDIDYTNGVVSGYISQDDLFNQINDLLLSPTCSCLGISDPVYTQDMSGAWNGTNCVDGASALCSAPGESVCGTLAGTDIGVPEVCPILGGLFASVTDLDLDGDTSNFEGLSLGFQFTGVPGTINGIAP
jgi:hypothetical protein